MRFQYPLLALAYTAAIQAADVQTVRNDIANITALMAALDSDVKLVVSGSAGIAQALQVQVDAVNIHEGLSLSVQHAKASPPFGSGGSLVVGLDFIALAPKVASTLQHVAAQKAALGELGIVVLSSLYQLKLDTDSFGAAVLDKLDALTKAIAPSIIASIDKAFNDAIVAFGGKGVSSPECQWRF
jgi:hypothetical protein